MRCAASRMTSTYQVGGLVKAERSNPNNVLKVGSLMAIACCIGCSDGATPVVAESVARVTRNEGNRGNEEASQVVNAPLIAPTMAPTANAAATAAGQPIPRDISSAALVLARPATPPIERSTSPQIRQIVMPVAATNSGMLSCSTVLAVPGVNAWGAARPKPSSRTTR